MRKTIGVFSGIALLFCLTQPLQAQTCGSDYTIAEGDSLAKIAGRVYGKASKWTLIFYANQDVLQGGGALIRAGQNIKIPCPAGSQQALPAAANTEATATPAKSSIVASPSVTKIRFLTAGDFEPYTDRGLPNGGLITNVIESAMGSLKADIDDQLRYDINWVNDWASHLNPLLSTRAFDVGFPWTRPPCSGSAELDADSKSRCRKYFYSDPIFETMEVLWVPKGSPITFEADDEVIGKTFCRPSGYFLYHLDIDGRNWLKDKKITLLQPQAVDECYRLLVAGEVDGVFLNELTGRSALIRSNLEDKVDSLQRPVHIGTLHAIVSKTHPNARTILYYINTGLKRLKDSGDYDEIVDKHMTLYWETEPEKGKEAEPVPSSSGQSTSTTQAAESELVP